MREALQRIAVAAVFIPLVRPGGMCAQSGVPAPEPSPVQTSPGKPLTVLRTSVRRVVLDVVVTDSHGVPVPHLEPSDFLVREDHEVQRVMNELGLVGFHQAESQSTRRPPPPMDTPTPVVEQRVVRSGEDEPDVGADHPDVQRLVLQVSALTVRAGA